MKRDWILLGAAVFALCLVQSYGWAEHWIFLGKHPLGEMSLDKDTVSYNGSVISYWARRMYYEPQESKISQMKFTEQRVLHVLNCEKRTMDMSRMIFLDAKGKPVGAYIDLKGGPQPIQPKGFFAKEAEMLCPSTVKKAPVKPAAKKPKAH